MQARTNPNAPPPSERRAGLAVGAEQPHAEWEDGIVLAYFENARAAQVQTARGNVLDSIPLLTAGSVWSVQAGDRVVVSYQLLRTPLIIGKYTPEAVPEERVQASQPFAATQATANYAVRGQPTDAVAGDWCVTGRQGHGLAVLVGGLTRLGGPRAEAVSSVQEGHFAIRSRTLNLRTMWGDVDFVHADGRTGVKVRGGSAYGSQTGFGQENYTLGLDAGAGDTLYSAWTAATSGERLVETRVGYDGAVESSCVSARIRVQGSTEAVLGPLTAQTGPAAYTVRGPLTAQVSGDVELLSAGSVAIGCGRSLVATAEDELLLKSSRGAQFYFAGQPPDPAWRAVLSGELSWEVSAQGAKSTLKVGRDTQWTTEAFKVSATSAEVSARTTQIGGDSTAAPDWETVRADLATALQALVTVLSAGTAGTAAAQTLTALPAQLPQLTSFIGKLRSPVYDSTRLRWGVR